MTINEYKDKLISVVKDMEDEHGFEIGGVEITVKSIYGSSEIRKYEVKIASE